MTSKHSRIWWCTAPKLWKLCPTIWLIYEVKVLPFLVFSYVTRRSLLVVWREGVVCRSGSLTTTKAKGVASRIQIPTATWIVLLRLLKVANPLAEWFPVYWGLLGWEVVFKIWERSHSSGDTWLSGGFVFHPYRTLTNISFARCDMILRRRIKSGGSTTVICRACQWGHKVKGWTSRRRDIYFYRWINLGGSTVRNLHVHWWVQTDFWREPWLCEVLLCSWWELGVLKAKINRLSPPFSALSGCLCGLGTWCHFGWCSFVG